MTLKLLPRMVFFVGEEDEEPEDVRNQDVDVVQVRLFNALQLLRDEVDENLNNVMM